MKKALQKMVVTIAAWFRAIIDEEAEAMFMFYNRWA